jgi:RNA polymerase sigma-70 factor (ECF subfamily)
MAKKPKSEQQNAVKSRYNPQTEMLRVLSAEELARRSQQGCRESFAELVARFGNRLFHFLHHKTNNAQDAEDLVQDTFVKAYKNIHRYQDSWKFSTWLFTIAARLANSHFRRSHSLRMVEEIEAQNPEPGQILADHESRQGLWALARQLSVNQYLVLWLKYGQDMSIKDISLVSGKSQVNVKVLLYRARINLAKKLKMVTVENEATGHMSSNEILSFMKVEGA